MRLTSLILIALLAANCAFSQQNVNPDPDGEPWIAGKLRPLTEEDHQKIENTPQLIYKQDGRQSLPDRVDNSELMYFRPVFNQDGGSCGQASGVGYVFTYEINRLRELPADVHENQYPTHFTWNFLNGGVGGGSWYSDGWEIIRATGCPNVEDYGGHYAYGGDQRWMSGYMEYENGMENRVYEIYTIDVSTEEGIFTLKQWLYDRMEGAATGGLACFAAGVGGSWQVNQIPGGQSHAGEHIITQWIEEVNHAMTFVGYDEEVMWDFNNDGKYTNDEDINNDGVVDAKDWEIGAVIMVNSWGTSFGDGGFAYVPYKLLAENQYNGGIWNSLVHIIDVKPEADPYMTLKATITHDSREKIQVTAGIASDPEAEEAEYVMNFPLFHHQGGDLYMQGGYSVADKTLELGLDITPLLSYVEPDSLAKFFLYVMEQDPGNAGTGEIDTFTVINQVTGEEIVCADNDVPLLENDTTWLAITSAINFEKVNIASDTLPEAIVNSEYEYQLEAENGHEPYNWSIKINYIESTDSVEFPVIDGEQLNPGSNDDGFAMVDLPFDFSFYGETFTQVAVSTDGSLLFDGAFEYIRNEQGLMAQKCITPYGSDLMIYPGQGDGMWYSGNEEFAAFRWKTSKYDNPGFDVEMAAILYPDGLIEFYYGTISESSGWVSGLSRGDQSSYLIAQQSGVSHVPENLFSEFSGGDFPKGISLTENGMLHGVPEAEGSWDLNFRVCDYDNIYADKQLPFKVNLNVGIPETGVPFEASVYPNPVTDVFNIQFGDIPIGKLRISLFTIDGKQRIRQYIIHNQKAGGKLTIPVSDLQAGVYLLRIASGGNSVTKKVIVQ